jgi:hypothetical protein
MPVIRQNAVKTINKGGLGWGRSQGDKILVDREQDLINWATLVAFMQIDFKIDFWDLHDSSQ